MGQPTYVLYDLREGEGFIQVRYRPHQAAADVTFVAPSLQITEQATTAWSRLLDGAGIEAAGHGIQRMFASLPESAAEVEVFYQAGFMFYAQEDIFALGQPVDGAQPVEVPGIRPQHPEDWPALQKLCVAITPQRVRQAEGGIVVSSGLERHCRRYVLPGDKSDEIVASVSLCSGSRAHWLRFLIHPEARDVAVALIRWALQEMAGEVQQPVYCNVRQYESGVRVALDEVGFEAFATRVLTVKHTVAWSKSPLQEMATALKAAESVPPAYRINGEPDFSDKRTLAATRDT
jgi:hypothetical protein